MAAGADDGSGDGSQGSVGMAARRVANCVISRQRLGSDAALRLDLGTTSTYLQGIDPMEIIDTIRGRRPPTISMTASLEL